MTTRQERLARAVASAGVSTVATAAAHVAGGGALPPLLLLAFVAVLGVGACLVLGGRRVTLPRLVLAAGTTQLLLHGLFSVAGHHATGAADGTGASGARVGAGALDAHLLGHAHGSVLPAVGDLAVATTAHEGSMLGAHVVAALVTIVSVRAGTGALRALVRAVALRLVAVVALVVGLGEPRRPLAPSVPVGGAAPVRAVSLRLAASRGLRGPPAPVVP